MDTHQRIVRMKLESNYCLWHPMLSSFSIMNLQVKKYENIPFNMSVLISLAKQLMKQELDFGIFKIPIL
jgi:hypothetical protein